MTQTGNIVANGLSLIGAGGTFTLTNAGGGNAITTLAANTGTISYTEADSFDVGTVTVTGGATTTSITTTADITLTTTGANAIDLTNDSITSSGGNITVTSGGALTLNNTSINASAGALAFDESTGTLTIADGNFTFDTFDISNGGTTALTFTGTNVFTVTGGTGIDFSGIDYSLAAGNSLAITVPDGSDLTVGAGGQVVTTLLADADVDGHLIFGGTVANGTDPFYDDTIEVDAATLTVGSDLTKAGDGSLTLLAGDVVLNGNISIPNGTIGIGANGDAAGTSGTIETNGAIRTLTSQGTTAGADVANIVMVADTAIDSLDIALVTNNNEVDIAVGLGGRIEFNELSNSQDVDTDPAFESSLDGGFLTASGFEAGVTFSFSLNPASNLIGLETLAFIDVGLFEEELTLFGQIGSGMALSLAQCEEQEGCAPDISEDEMAYLIESLEARLLELERRLAEESDPNVRADLEELIEGFNNELKEFNAYRQELEAFFAEDDEESDEELDEELEDDSFFDENVSTDEVERLAKVLETVKARIEWLTGLKAKPEERARLGKAIGIELTQEALDKIIDAAKSEAVFIENQIKLLLESKEANLNNGFGSPVFTAEARDYSSMQTLHYNSDLLTLNDSISKSLADYY